jgi:parvulin-like peptidyl-prolyl isomerase
MTDSTVEVQEIYILLDEEAGKDKAFADDLARKARSGQNFTRLVKKHSDRKSAMGREGKIGPITSRQYGAMGKAAFELEIGQISDPIKMGRRGYSVIKLLDKTPARIKTFDECKTQVQRQYRMEKTTELRDEWMAELENRFNVTIYEDKLMAILPQPEVAEGDTLDTAQPTQVEPKMRTIPLDKKGGGN